MKLYIKFFIKSKVNTKNKFKFLCHCLHLPINNNDLNFSNDDNQNDNDDIMNWNILK